MAADEQSYDPERCTPCRGTGKLISGKGGEHHEVPCAWCGGTGRFQPGRNAQDPDGEPAADATSGT